MKSREGAQYGAQVCIRAVQGAPLLVWLKRGERVWSLEPSPMLCIEEAEKEWGGQASAGVKR